MKRNEDITDKHKAHQIKMYWEQQNKIARKEAHNQKRWRKPRPYCGNLL